MAEKTTTGRLIAAAGGILLIISLFLKWYGVDIDVPDTSGQFGQAVQGAANDLEDSASGNAFDMLGWTPFLYLLIGIAAILPAVFDIFDLDIELPFDLSYVALVGGAIALGGLLIVMDGPGGTKIGAWLALLATILITAGGVLQMSEDDDAGAQYAQVAAPPAQAPPVAQAPPPAQAPPAQTPPPAAPPQQPPAGQPPQAPPPAV